MSSPSTPDGGSGDGLPDVHDVHEVRDRGAGDHASAPTGAPATDPIASYRAASWPGTAPHVPPNGAAPPSGGFPVPERPPLPKPERLNRNALTVAAVVMGTLVLAAVIFMPPTHAGPGQGGARPAPVPASGTFLDQPVAGQVGVQGVPANAPANAPAHATSAAVPNNGSRVVSTPDPYAVTSSPYAAVPSAAAPSLPAPPADPKRLAYEAALGAPLTASEARASADAEHTRDIRGIIASTGELTGEVLPEPAATASAPTAGVTGVTGVTSLTTTPTQAVQALVAGSSHERFLANARAAQAAQAAQATVVRTSVAPAPGPYALLAGTMIPAVLVTEVNSDLPGEVLAQVARDVYDSRTQRDVLVPKGARLLGTYEHEVGAEQRRLLVVWTRLVFPDGRSVALPALQAKDRTGAGGLADRVDRHEGRVFGTAALLSLLGAGAQLAQPNGGYGLFGGAPSTGQVMAGAVGQQLADVATQMLRRDLDVRPTIHVRQGMPFNVFLNVDLAFAAPYRASAAEP